MTKASLTFILTVVLLYTAVANAQESCEMLLNNKNYHSAQARGETEEQARILAADLLLNQLSTVVTSTTETRNVESNEGFQQIFTGETKSTSKLKLQGLKYITCERRRRDKNTTVVAYISREDLEKSAKAVSKQVDEYLQLIQSKEQLNINPIQDIYAAYLYTHTTPYPVKGMFKGKIRENVQIHLRNELTKHLANVQVQTRPAMQTLAGIEEQFAIPLSLQNAQTATLRYSIDCPSHSTQTIFKNNKAVLPLILRPSDVTEQMRCQLSYTPKQPAAELSDVAESLKLSKNVTVQADFSETLSVDFLVRTQNNYYLLTPDASPISVRTIEWSFADQTSKEQILRIEKDNAPREVTLTINGQPKFSITKTLQPGAEPADSDRADAEIHPKAVQLKNLSDYGALSSQLTDWKNKGSVAMGQKTDFQNPDNCWVALIDPETRHMKHLLTPGGEMREDIISNKTYNGFHHFKGLVAIWLEFY